MSLGLRLAFLSKSGGKEMMPRLSVLGPRREGRQSLGPRAFDTSMIITMYHCKKARLLSLSSTLLTLFLARSTLGRHTFVGWDVRHAWSAGQRCLSWVLPGPSECSPGVRHSGCQVQGGNRHPQFPTPQGFGLQHKSQAQSARWRGPWRTMWQVRPSN